MRTCFAAACGRLHAHPVADLARARHQDRAGHQPGRHRGLAGAGQDGAADRGRLRLPRRRHPGSRRQGGPRQHGRRPARRRRGRARRQDVPRTAGGEGDPARLQHQSRQFPWLAAHADGASRRGVRALAAFAHRPAIRGRRSRAHTRPGDRAAHPRDHESQRDRRQALVVHGFPHAPLRPPGERHARNRAAHRQRRSQGLRGSRSRARQSEGRGGGRHRCGERRRVPRQRVRRAPGESRSCAGRRRAAGRARAPHRGRPRCPAGCGDVRRSRDSAQGSGFHGRLYRQPHSRRRLVLLAPLSRGARKTRARLLGAQLAGLARSCGDADGRDRHARRARGRNDRSSSSRRFAGSPKAVRPRTSCNGRSPISRARTRSASTLPPRSPASWCRSSSTTWASTTSTAAPP